MIKKTSLLQMQERGFSLSAMHRRYWWAILWALWIFATSCTVILSPAFIEAISQFLPQGAARQQWSYAWMTFGLFVIKCYHVSEYTVLCLLLFAALRTLRLLPARALMCSAGAAILFAASDEWHQTFVPGRGGTWVDVCIDSFGVGLASFWILRGIAKHAAQQKAFSIETPELSAN